MKTCTQTAALQQHFGVEGAIRQIAASGFDHYDVTMTFLKDDDNVFNSPEWRTETEKLRRVAEECGITCHQAHAPFPSSKAETEENRHYNEVIFDRIVRSMEIAALLGARQIVIHPKHHVNYYANREALTELNLAFYRDLLPYAKRFGIRVAVENMFQRDMVRGNVIVESTCADPREFCAYLDALDPEWFVGCLDIGHVGLVSRSAPDVIRALGHDRIHALHVHDNDFVNDLHTLPFTRKLPWEEIIRALAEIRYDGVMTLEADGFLKSMPEELLPDATRLMAKVARYLADRVQKQMDERAKD